MKLKTLPLFYTNLSFKLLALTCLGLFTIKASYSSEVPGIIESFERLLEVHYKQIENVKVKAQSNLKNITALNEVKDFRINSEFLQSLILHSEDKYLSIAASESCRFYSSLETNLLKTTYGETNSILLDYTNKNGEQETGIINRADFFEQIYKIKCFNNKEYNTLFNTTNVQKTIEGIKFNVPKNKSECSSIHQEWLNNPFTPHLCEIRQELKKQNNRKNIEFYKSKIPILQRTYIENLCNHLDSAEKFCENYLKKDAWNMVINGEAPDYKISYKCQSLLGKADPVNLKDIKNCAAKFLTEPKTCETRSKNDYPSNYPLQNCDVLSSALAKSNLVTNYQDCPGNVDNEAITNIHRIVNHFAPRNLPTGPEHCGSEANYSFAKLNFEINHEDGWPLKVCYLNRVSGKETCTPYIPGSRDAEPLSEDQVIAKILYLQKGASSKTKCKIVSSSAYNPLRSEFKFGCFILYNQDTCSTLSCEKKVIWDEKIQSDIKFIGTPVFDYFPTAYLNERYSFYSMLNETKGTQQRTVKNLTDLKFYLDKMPHGILHGVGCIEDLLPEEFSRISINQCRPIPFIIDGYTQFGGDTWLVSRISIDDIHTPRLLQWQNVFNSVSAYRELHPLNTWTLYGIKK